MLVLMVHSLVSVVVLCGAGGARVVHTGRGAVRGRLAPRGHYAYLGIPYARHARSDRFKAPKPAKSWDGIFEATYQVKCPQPDGSGTEDCLVLNVFSPEHAADLPVLVVVHGGNFRSGWGPFRPPARLLAQDLVVVTFNYRLGALGFLCLGTSDAPGNAGLKDQVAALYWVHKNIAHFGGNPLDVSLYGIESGAASIQLIMLSGAATGLFHKVILESGSALSPLALAYDPKLTAFDAAAAMGFTGTDNLDELTKFYKDSPLNRLVNETTTFLPCLENNLDTTHSLLEMDPLESYKQRNYQKVPMIIAYTSSAGASSIETVLTNSNLPENFDDLLPNNVVFDSADSKHRVAEVVKVFYVGRNVLDSDLVKNYIEYFNDVTLEYPIIKSAVLHAATSSMPIYLMKLNRDGTKKSEKNKGYKSMFDYFYDDHTTSKEDQLVVEQLVTLWSNFIKIG
ncbi:hypothetical protein ABMA28_007453 [Loxostege sticticalis]|uniref:Carboxylesterase type B domain-containing protein n=1 Tax=Loxostege sticticalis TaxID=481309 RepID=A0ABD0SIF6_LOXSC